MKRIKKELYYRLAKVNHRIYGFVCERFPLTKTRLAVQDAITNVNGWLISKM